MKLTKGSIIQMPAASRCPLLLCVVVDVDDSGVKCFALVPGAPHELPGRVMIRVAHGEYTETGGRVDITLFDQ